MPLNETEYIKLIFLLSDTQQWLNDLSKEALTILPVSEKRKLLQKQYYLSITALAHILEHHYYKIPRYPSTGKFHLSLADILYHVREAINAPVNPVPGALTFQRVIKANQVIGFDKKGEATSFITILTDGGGKIITAFPGMLPSATIQSICEVQSHESKEQVD